MPDETTQEKGKKGEDLAEAFLVDQGYTILEKNFRYSRYGEIDLIVGKEQTTVFVEVRLKKKHSPISALDSINPQKLARIRKTASAYIHSRSPREKDEMFRFDIITIEAGEISWFRDVLR